MDKRTAIRTVFSLYRFIDALYPIVLLASGLGMTKLVIVCAAVGLLLPSFDKATLPKDFPLVIRPWPNNALFRGYGLICGASGCALVILAYRITWEPTRVYYFVEYLYLTVVEMLFNYLRRFLFPISSRKANESDRIEIPK